MDKHISFATAAGSYCCSCIWWRTICSWRKISNRDDLSNKLFVYNPLTNKWIEDANLLTAHCVLIANSYMKFYMQYKELTTPEHPAPTGLMILRLIHGYQYNQCQ